jgi:mRNA interferase MazF
MTRFGMNIQPAEIVGIPFPYTDMATEKRRPVHVMTGPDQRGDFTGLAITSVPTQDKSVCIGLETMKSGRLPRE